MIRHQATKFLFKSSTGTSRFARWTFFHWTRYLNCPEVRLHRRHTVDNQTNDSSVLVQLSDGRVSPSDSASQLQIHISALNVVADRQPRFDRLWTAIAPPKLAIPNPSTFDCELCQRTLWSACLKERPHLTTCCRSKWVKLKTNNYCITYIYVYIWEQGVCVLCIITIQIT